MQEEICVPTSDVPAVDWASNRARLVDALTGDFLVLLLSGEPLPKSADERYPFCANRNFLYVTGLDRPRQALVVVREGSRLDEVLFVEPVDPRAERWTGKMMTMEEAAEISGIRAVRPIHQLEAYLAARLGAGVVHDVYLDLERRRWTDPPSSAQRFARRFEHRYPGLRIHDVYPVLAQLRRLKAAGEIARLRQAVTYTASALHALARAVQPGRYEYELEAEFRYILGRSGVEPAYASIVATGLNATCMHYTALTSRVGSDDMVLVDAAAEYAGYKADITRTFPARRRFSTRQRDVYEIVWEASRETIAQIRPGVPHARLNETTRRVLADGLKSLHLIRVDDELNNYYFYNVSHYIGLDTHDVGAYAELEPGMVLTVEPGLYIDAEALGIRIEDDIVVTETGHDVLSADIPADPDEVVAWMAE